MRVAVAALLLTSAMLTPSPAAAENPYINIPEQQALANQARIHWWNSLTDRQKYLVRAVSQEEDAYREAKGTAIPLNQRNLVILMQRIGAQPNETQFVSQRMQVHQNVDADIKRADDLINRITNDPVIWGGRR
jgi:hypothetical protein